MEPQPVLESVGSVQRRSQQPRMDWTGRINTSLAALDTNQRQCGVQPERRDSTCGWVQAVEALLAAGAAPNARDALGGTPLHCAVRANCTTAASALLAAAADPTAADVAGVSPLELATSSAMRQLLRRRAL